MSGSTFGQVFRVTTFGESHGPALGAIVDGCPPQLALSEADLQPDLDRRRPGQGRLSSARREKDQVRILSGVVDGLTTGTPIALQFQNTDARSKNYDHLRDVYRPSHADYTYDQKFGLRDVAGGGRSSARETAARVAAGGIAKKLLAEAFGVTIVGWVDRTAGIQADVDPTTVTREDVAAGGEVQCPDLGVADAMTAAISAARKDGDTVGGVVSCVARDVPSGWGNPIFDKLDARLAAAMMSLPAAKGVEVGSGFAGVDMRGSEHNDAFAPGPDGGIVTTTNRSGGIQGGISNGMPVFARVAFKPVATIFSEQQTVTRDGVSTTLSAKGRHDPCVLPRAVVIVEAMMALTLCDAWLLHRAQTGR